MEFNEKVEIRNVSWKYSETGPDILKDISFDIIKGTSVAFIGQSGAGKTTLIRLICGLQEPGSGSYRIYGIKNTDPQIVRSRRRMGQLWRHHLFIWI